MARLYIYVVDRDFGFAPNPFHGYCSLATCKPKLRQKAQIGDWVVGVGGRRLAATGRCIFAMRVSSTASFNEYWSNPAFSAKKPVRNGSRKMLVGDNIYHYDFTGQKWEQADSHHSNSDGTPNLHNLAVDTRADRVLLSDHFYYFGDQAPVIPADILRALGYENGRSYRVFNIADGSSSLTSWLAKTFRKELNMVTGDPFDFGVSERRYSVKDNRIT